jgi:hypothetical protein
VSSQMFSGVHHVLCLAPLLAFILLGGLLLPRCVLIDVQLGNPGFLCMLTSGNTAKAEAPVGVSRVKFLQGQ